MKIPQFHAAFMTEMWTKQEENEIKSLKFSKSSLSKDAKY
jgi:L-ribulose-5-phosphate 3-epimerase UlaE